jgi:UDP-glucose 4-epimerase
MSSSEIYGDATRPAIDESHPTRPKTPYAASKVAAEAYVNAFQKTYGLPSIIIRPFNTFGPRQRGFKRHESDRYGGMVSRSVYSALHSEEIIIYGDGTQTRDYMYVTDCVRGIIAAAREDLRGQIMNLASGKAVSMSEIVRSAEDATGNVNLRITYRSERPGDVKHQCGDISLAARLINFKPSYDFAEGLAEYVRWARSIQ